MPIVRRDEVSNEELAKMMKECVEQMDRRCGEVLAKLEKNEIMVKWLYDNIGILKAGQADATARLAAMSVQLTRIEALIKIDNR